MGGARGVPGHRERARVNLEIASRAGDAWAPFYLGTMHHQDHDDQQAIEYWRLAVDRGPARELAEQRLHDLERSRQITADSRKLGLGLAAVLLVGILLVARFARLRGRRRPAEPTTERPKPGTLRTAETDLK